MLRARATLGTRLLEVSVDVDVPVRIGSANAGAGVVDLVRSGEAPTIIQRVAPGEPPVDIRDLRDERHGRTLRSRSLPAKAEPERARHAWARVVPE